MRLVELAAFLLAALLPAASRAAGITVTDVERSFSRLSLIVAAEVVQHHRESYLLVRIQPYGLRTISGPDGKVETVLLKDSGLAFLPVTVACDRMVLKNNGRTYKPDFASLCRQTARFANENTAPVFVAFRYPPKGPTEIVVPATVSKPDPPVQRVLDRSTASSAPSPADPLVGDHELVVRLYVGDPPKR